MTDRQRNRHEMHVTVLGVLDAHADAWAAVPAAQKHRDALEALVADTRKAVQDQARSPQGATAAKGSVRDQVARDAWRLGQAIAAWATENDRPDVAGAVVLSRTDFDRLPDATLAEYSEIVVAEAREHLPAEGEDPTTGLGEQGVTAAFVDALDALDDQFARDLATPREAIVDRSRATRALAVAVRDAQRLLKKKLDPTVAFLAPDAPAFADAYRAARIIVDRGTGRGPAPDADPDAGPM